MAEPTRFTSLEADAGGLPTFTTPSSIFDIPNTLLGGFPIGADAGMGFLQGTGPTFTAPSTGDFTFSFGAPGSMAPGGLSLADQLNPYNIRTDITQLAPNWGTWNPSTDVTTAGEADMTGVRLSGQPFNNAPVLGSEPRTDIGSTVQTGAQETAIMMDPFKVKGTTEPSLTLDPNQYVTSGALGGSSLLGGVSTSAADTGGVVMLDPFQVSGTKDQGLPKATFSFAGTTPSGGTGSTLKTDTGVETLPTVTVTESKPKLPTVSTQDKINLLNKTMENIGTGVFVPPKVEVPDTTVKKDDGVNTNLPPTNTTSSTTVYNTGTTATSTSTTSSAMNQRDLKAELEKTMAAFDAYRPKIQQMYGDLYQQFMPKGLTAAEPGIINQYQADLARLQQRQAGMLSPEDVRQSQQSAREAYGARGQVMGPGAIGAEILNREAIRQQREDQARAALQSSYGNVLNMANLQTGNLFSPIASLMSSTFNPLGAYPADVYGTNVNAQLARDIAQKNYEAAIRSAELQGSAAKSAANTSLFGDFFKTAVGVKVYVNCMPGDQVIDTPVGPAAVESIKGGDEVIGYDGSVAKVLQVCSYVQDGDKDFFTFHLSNGGKITVCDRHKIMDIPASEWVVGATMGDAIIERIDRKSGITTSYDLVTEVSGYRIAGVPVNSMIPEMLALTLQLVALKQIA